ncbi:zinc finger protein 470 [Drosophila innubila]|uniref:zinc finger protein 470 n=1 Tax=Drosophila innubila TaxID=198719 RepID=UPI00148BF9D0|nr:zinc finger protein 470 [Drosophila innubila]
MLTMRTLSDNNCLTCLLKMDRDSVQERHTMDMKMERLLLRHLNWQQQELNAELMPKQLCSTCHQLLLSFEQFREQANECRQRLLEMLEQSQQTGSFEFVYEKEEKEQEEEQLLEEEQQLLAITAVVNSDDPFEEAVETCASPEKQRETEMETALKSRRRCKGVKNSFKCTLCGHCFAHSLTLEAHVRKVHEGNKRPFKCDRCDKSYSFMGGLYTHIKELHSTQARSYQCDYPGCQRVYISCIAMQKHKRLKHSSNSSNPLNNRQYVCEECGATFNQTANLKYHRRTKHPTAAEAAENARNNEQHYCDVCQKHFHSRYTLKYHTMQQHSDADGVQHECQICGRRLAKRFMLVQHMLMHTADKMPCEHCGRLFARKFELEAHIRAVHLKLKPFDCKYCSESFASRKTLRHHEYIHTGEKPYVCQVCGQAFRQQTCLKNHGKVHDKLPPSTSK